MNQMQMVCVGKLKEKYWVDACSEYMKRLTAYTKMQVVELTEEKAPEDLGEAEIEKVKHREGQRILAALRPDDYVVALAVQGEAWSSEKLAEHIERLGVYGGGRVAFLIGGSLGLADEVLARSDVQLSFSKMTFPHQMMRVILLEQVYRAFRIMRGHSYHK